MDSWVLVALASPLLGFLWWLGLSARHGFLYVKGFLDKLAFFMSPYGPSWYVLLKYPDGGVEQFYDLRKSPGRGRYFVELDGPSGPAEVVMDRDPDELAQMLSLWDARAPSGQPSPFGLAWRVLVGWAFAVYAAFLAWDFTFLGGGGAEGWVSMLVFTIEFSYMWQLMRQLQLPQTRYLGLIVVGVSPPHYRAVPEVSVFNPEPPAKLFAALGRSYVIKLPENSEKVFRKLVERLGGDEYAAAWLVYKASLADKWRKSLAELRDEMRTVKTVARRMVRTRELRELSRPSLGKIMIWLLILGVGIVIGYVFGSSWAISAHPPPWYSNASHAAASTAYAQPSVTPAPMPSPPIPPSTHTPVTPANPPAPPTTTPHHPPVSPAPAPPPPTNTTRG